MTPTAGSPSATIRRRIAALAVLVRPDRRDVPSGSPRTAPDRFPRPPRGPSVGLPTGADDNGGGRLAMFAQLIQGRTSDAEAVRTAMDRWMQELQPGSIGWLGSTGGGADDGRFVAVARFESAEAAARNSARPEQSRWWEETQRLFDGEVTFADSEDVEVDLTGDPDRAGFVQVMQGRVTDRERMKELLGRMSTEEM